MRSRILKRAGELAHLIRSGVAQFGIYKTASKIGCVIRVTQEIMHYSPTRDSLAVDRSATGAYTAVDRSANKRTTDRHTAFCRRDRAKLSIRVEHRGSGRPRRSQK